MKMKQAAVHFLVVLVLLAAVDTARADGLLYTLNNGVRLRGGPGLQYKVLAKLPFNGTLIPSEKEGRWFHVATPEGAKGWVREDMVSDTWIKVHKKERLLFLMKGEQPVRSWPIALAPANPLGDKVRRGDSGTPEGRFFICNSVGDPRYCTYGPRSMRISYPNAEDAKRGLESGLIDRPTCNGIVRAVSQGRQPNQLTVLGGYIQIHGGGSSRHWTLGCIALEDEDIIELYDLVPRKARVEIYHSAPTDREINKKEK